MSVLALANLNLMYERGEVNVQTVAEEIDKLWHRLSAKQQIDANRWLLENVVDDN